MARDGSGAYSLPAGSIVADGETAVAAQHNTPLQDIETDLNAARPIVAGGTGATTASAARTNLGVNGAVKLATITFDAISDMNSSADVEVGDYALVREGYNGEPETFEIVAASTYTANSQEVYDLSGSGLQAVSLRTWFKAVAELQADTRGYASFTTGDYLTADEYSYEIQPAVTADEDISNAASVKLYVRPHASAVVNVMALGADDTGATDATAIFTQALSRFVVVKAPSGVFLIDGTIELPDGKSLIGDSAGGLFLNTTTTTTGTLLVKDSGSTDGPILRFTTSGTCSGIQFRHRKINGGTEGIVAFGDGASDCVYNSLHDCSIFGDVTEDRSGTNTCYGLYFGEVPNGTAVYWNRVSNVQITNIDVGAYLGGQVNANHFTNVLVKEVLICFWLDGGGTECIDNIFAGCGAYNGAAYSPDPVAVKLEGTTKYNVFNMSTELFGKAFDVTGTSTGNIFMGQTNEINPSDFGDKNTFLSGVKGEFAGQSRFKRDLTGGAVTDEVVQIDRIGTFGRVLEVLKDGVLQGSIHAKDGDLAIGTGAAGHRYIDSVPAVAPFDATAGAGTDNACDLGTSGSRYRTLYATGIEDMQQITFASISAATAANDTLFLDTATGKISFKDSSGTVNALY